MGIFDFFKKKELIKIQELTFEVERLRKNLHSTENEKQELKNKNTQLESEYTELKKYEHIKDVCKEAENIIFNSNKEAKNIIDRANEEVAILKKDTEESLGEITLEIQHLEQIKKGIIDLANNQAKDILKDLRLKVQSLKNKADFEIENSISIAKKIILDAEEKAKEIVGDAYQMNRDLEELNKTIEALKNKKKGYSDIYITPTYTLLDDLSIDYNFTQAGRDLAQARIKTKSFIQNNSAAVCDYVEPLRKETAINFITEAFNGKVDSILSNIKHDNFGILKQKIIDSYYIVNDLGKAFRNTRIVPEYLEARIKELTYAVIVMELKKQEQEEQRRIREEIKEEERARREYEKALKDAEKEQNIIRRTLEKAQKDFEKASEHQKQKYEDILQDLERKLKDAEEKSQRALSMAQQTKSGHIYIISNIGSFGENVYKIGMTRRLEPMDRVRELGDASVPFPFDIHAMIYTENAPKLEKELHKCFIDNQINKINFRKEFFNVNLKDIRKKLEELNIETKWTMVAEATEYRESLVIAQEINSNSKVKEHWETIQRKQIEIAELEKEEIE